MTTSDEPAWWHFRPETVRLGIIVGAIVSVLLLISAAVVWFALPRWAPAFVVKYSPSVALALQAAENGQLQLEIRDRLNDWSDVAPALCAALGNDSPWQRRVAAEILGRRKYQGAVNLLIEALSGNSKEWAEVEARNAAAYALWEIGDPRAVPAVLGATSRLSSAVPRWLKDRIHLIRHPDYFELIDRHLLRSGDAELRAYGRFMLHDNNDPRALAVIYAGLGKDLVEGEDLAASALGRSRQPGTLPLIKRALEDPDPALRRSGAIAAEQNGDSNLALILRTLATSTAEPEDVRKAAVMALSAQPEADSLATLDRVIDEDGPLAFTAIDVLYLSKWHHVPGFSTSLVNHLGHPDAKVRQRIVSHFKYSPIRPDFTPDLVARLVALLDDPDADVVKAVRDIRYQLTLTPEQQARFDHLK